MFVLLFVMAGALLFMFAAFNVGSPKVNLFYGGWACLAIALLIYLWPKFT